jgi:rhamnogalacturonyl hydrolase YesR
MFVFALARGASRGWIDASNYAPVAITGWNGLTSKIGDDGHLESVCIGTGWADEFVWYYHRPAADDLHGYGPVLMAGAEMIKLLTNDQLEIRAEPNRQIMVLPRNQAQR